MMRSRWLLVLVLWMSMASFALAQSLGILTVTSDSEAVREQNRWRVNNLIEELSELGFQAHTVEWSSLESYEGRLLFLVGEGTLEKDEQEILRHLAYQKRKLFMVEGALLRDSFETGIWRDLFGITSFPPRFSAKGSDKLLHWRSKLETPIPSGSFLQPVKTFASIRADGWWTKTKGSQGTKGGQEGKLSLVTMGPAGIFAGFELSDPSVLRDLAVRRYLTETIQKFQGVKLEPKELSIKPRQLSSRDLKSPFVPWLEGLGSDSKVTVELTLYEPSLALVERGLKGEVLSTVWVDVDGGRFRQGDGGAWRDLGAGQKVSPHSEAKGFTLYQISALGAYRSLSYQGGWKLEESEGKVRLIAEVDREVYLASVVSKEMSPSFELEALKAQAVVARTYMESHRLRHQGVDICDSIHCQVYKGHKGVNERCIQAVLETRGLVLLKADGSLASTFYHSTCGGFLEEASRVFSASSKKVTRLLSDLKEESSQDLKDPDQVKALIDASPSAYCERSKYYRWEQSWPVEQVQEQVGKALKKLGYTFEGKLEIREIRVEGYASNGRVQALAIESEQGEFLVEGSAVRWLMSGGEISSQGFRSTFFYLEYDPQEGLSARGAGWGHGVGMCQMGAQGRALEGSDFLEILSFYYPEFSLGRWEH